jgi:Phage tail assembly chaperone proteins, E, or 41 or 14
MPEVRVPLSRPLTTHEGDKKELVLREPTARDYIAMRRVPFSLLFHQETRATNPDQVSNRTGELVTDYDLAFQWLERLTGVSILILETLKGRDVSALVDGLRVAVMSADDQEDEKKVDDQVKNSSASAPT